MSGALKAGIVGILLSAGWVHAGDRVLRQRIARLGPASEIEDLAYFKAQRRAPELLLKELRIIHAPRVLDQEEKSARDLHVLWCLRALEEIYGLRFSAPTNHRFDPEDRLESDREMETESEDRPHEYYFYDFRETLLTYYLAPEDVQASVIKQWKDHVVKTHLPSCEDGAKRSLDAEEPARSKARDTTGKQEGG